MLTPIDYADTGLSISEAMLDDHKKNSLSKDRSERLPGKILWAGKFVQTSDCWRVSKTGIIEGEIVSCKSDVQQGFDINVDGGYVLLAQDEKVPLLRTWKDERFEDVVRYPFFSESGRIDVWNVFRRTFASGAFREDKWTENAGFWIEQISEQERIYHCSHGMVDVPDFGLLVFRIRIEK